MVLLYPVLIDLKAQRFAGLYADLIALLRKEEIHVIDLTKNLNSFKDQDLWITPFDQHPNETANKIFAREAAEGLAKSIPNCYRRN